MQHQLLRLSFLPLFRLVPVPKTPFFSLVPVPNTPLFWVVPVPKTPLFWVVPVPKTPLFGCAAAHPHQYISRVPPPPPRACVIIYFLDAVHIYISVQVEKFTVKFGCSLMISWFRSWYDTTTFMKLFLTVFSSIRSFWSKMVSANTYGYIDFSP